MLLTKVYITNKKKPIERVVQSAFLVLLIPVQVNRNTDTRPNKCINVKQRNIRPAIGYE